MGRSASAFFSFSRLLPGSEKAYGGILGFSRCIKNVTVSSALCVLIVQHGHFTGTSLRGRYLTLISDAFQSLVGLDVGDLKTPVA